MIRTLQKKFIFTAMTAITVLLLVLLGGVNIANCMMVGHQTDRMLQMLAESEAWGAPPEGPKQWEEKRFWAPAIDEDEAMSARYFLVQWNREGEIIRADVSRISSVTEIEARAYGADAAMRSTTVGQMDRFKYRFVNTPEGSLAGVFLDVSTQRRSMLSVLAVSVLAGLLCWGLMLVLVAALSRRAIRPIAANMERQKQFVTDAGHEIKTPLAIILANIEALELHGGESKWSRNIRAQTVRLNGLMQDLLTLARMEENGAKAATENVGMSALTKETAEAFREPAALRSIALETEITPGITLRANREHMIRLLTILLDNAVKYTDEGGSISLTLRQEERRTVLQVKNTCAHVPEDAPEKLFDRFYRGDSARTQRSGGYGIGLSVARAMAEAQGGTITASYEGGNAVVFTVRL